MKIKTNRSKTTHPIAKEKLAIKLPMDYPWKVLGWLSQDLAGIIGNEDYDYISQIIRERDTGSLMLLSDEWGLQKLKLQEDISLAKLRAKYQLSALLKKFRFPSNKELRIDSAKQKFLNAESTCSEYNHGGYMKIVAAKTELSACYLTSARAFLAKLLGERTPTNRIVTEWSRHGPGSNLDTKNGAVSIYDKYENWPYSCTSLALPYARYLIQSDQRWFGALQNSYRQRNNIPMHAIINMEEFWINVFRVVEGNRITFVPKNALTERSIAIEPTMNLMLQLGVDGHIRRRLKRWGIDLDCQKKNQVLAYQGSIRDDEESFVTLDLSAASDTISLAICKILLPPDWYNYLLKLRSPCGILDNETIFYEKISSMGNGFTFALESAIFSALIYAIHKEDNPNFDPRTEFAVFGDDLIVRKKHVNSCIELLQNAGFTINTDKSFLDGKIRESCGADWFQGKLIRPVFFDEIPTDAMELLTDVNRLKRILSLRWGLEESLTVKNMIKWLPEFIQELKGPCSDTEFDSHLHCDSFIGFRYKNCMWEYQRLVKTAVPKEAKDFFFRKLMVSLRGKSHPITFKVKRRFSSASVIGER